MHHGKVIVYVSKQLRKHEHNYPKHNIELVGVLFALKILQHYLYGVNIDIFTYHQSIHCLLKHKELSLREILKQKELNLRQRIWIELLNDYDVDILYHPHKDNDVADGVSRKIMVVLRYVKLMGSAGRPRVF